MFIYYIDMFSYFMGESNEIKEEIEKKIKEELERKIKDELEKKKAMEQEEEEYDIQKIMNNMHRKENKELTMREILEDVIGDEFENIRRDHETNAHNDDDDYTIDDESICYNIENGRNPFHKINDDDDTTITTTVETKRRIYAYNNKKRPILTNDQILALDTEPKKQIKQTNDNEISVLTPDEEIKKKRIKSKMKNSEYAAENDRLNAEILLFKIREKQEREKQEEKEILSIMANKREKKDLIEPEENKSLKEIKCSSKKEIKCSSKKEKKPKLKRERISLQDIEQFNIMDNDKTLNTYQLGKSNEIKTVHSLDIIRKLCILDDLKKFKNDYNLSTDQSKLYLADVYYQLKKE